MTQLHSFRQRLRGLSRSPGFSASVILCLTLGLAAAAIVLAVVDAFLLRPLPYREPSRLMAVWKVFHTEAAAGQKYFLRPGDFVLLRDEIRTLDVAAAQPVDVDVSGIGEPERVSASRSSGNLFSLLGIPAVAGRVLELEDERQQAAVAVVGSAWARRRFGDVSAALGQTLTVDGWTVTVVGVVDQAAAYPDGAELWVPLTRREYEGRLGLGVVARLGQGQTPRAAIEEVTALGRRLREIDPNLNGQAGLEAEGLQAALVEDVEQTLLALLAAVACLALIAGANAASLVLARAQRFASERRTREILGASRWRLLFENAFDVSALAGLSLMLALGLAMLVLPSLIAVSPLSAFSFAPIQLSSRVVAWVAALAALAALAFTALWLVTEGRGIDSPGLAGSRIVAGRRGLSLVVVVDVALTVVLLIGAGLILRTVNHLSRVDPGFRAAEVSTLGVSASPSWSEEHTRRVTFYDRVLEEVSQLAGVETAAAVNKLPMTQPEFYVGFNVEGKRPANPEDNELALFRVVTPDYFKALQLPLREGRPFDSRDDAEAPLVAVANVAFVERHWPGEHPLGRRVKRGRYDNDNAWIEIVGVVASSRERGLSEPVTPALYIPYPQWSRRYLSRMHLVVRTDPGEASVMPAVRERVRQVDPGAVFFDSEPMMAVVARSTRQQRFLLVLLTAFASLALVQAAAGLYGVMSYDVQARTREIGVRVALGARPHDVWIRVVGLGALRAGVGLAMGGFVALALTHWSRRLWIGVEPADGPTYLAVCVVIATTVLLATLPAARRAVALDPVRTLRSD